MNEDFIQNRLQAQKEQGLQRKLSANNSLIDFSSNDYLGFTRSNEFNDLFIEEVERLNSKHGSTGSRLLSGNSFYIEELESEIARFHEAEAGLIFNSGYDANLGLISSVARKGDFVFYDELSHASIYDGVRLSKADSFPFKHNDIEHLKDRLKFFQKSRSANSSCFVVVESVYSMDGDFSPLAEISLLCETYQACLIVDEAHATGIFGDKGEGVVVQLGLQNKVFARVHTFGKALGCHGAIVLSSLTLKKYLINFSRSFIYTTALPFHSLAAIKTAYKTILLSKYNILKINSLINLFKDKYLVENIRGFSNSYSAIQSFIFKGNENVKMLANLIQKDGYDVRPIISPTIPKGKERIRICLHTYNTPAEISGLLLSLKKNLELLLEKQLVE